MKKVCTKCKQSKTLDEFGWKNKEAGKHHPRCKQCMRDTCNSLYQTSKTRKKSIRSNSKDQQRSTRELIRRYKEFVGCMRCKDPKVKKYYLLDLHHRYGKDSAVSQMMGRGRLIVKAEVRKCDVLCANCHREEHHQAELKKGKRKRMVS